MFSHVLICLCALLSVQLTLQEWAIDDSGCITPDNGVGDCVDIYDCEPIINVLELHVKRNKIVSERLKSILAKHLCGVGKVTKVCCPRVYKTPINPTAPEISKPSPTPKQTPAPKPTPPPTPAPTLPTANVIITNSTPSEIANITNLQIIGRNLLPQDSCGFFESEDRVSMGQRAALFEFPWMALLAYETNNGIQYLCGGSLINDRYILTAAHCLMDMAGRKLSYIRLGELDIGNVTDCDVPQLGDPVCLDPTEDIPPEDVIIHPSFNFTTFQNDIGLIRLKRRIEIKDHISPICLPITTDQQNAAMKSVVFAGWGLTENGTRSEILLKADVSIMDQTECRKIYRRSFISVSENHMCTGGLTRKGSCSGDSGGPIQVLHVANSNIKYVQYGILSLGPSICGDVGLPGIHTKVIPYMDWIVSTIKL